MKKSTIILASVVGFLVVVGLWFVSTMNSFVQKEEAIKSAWSQVENVYQRRADLIPNLVNTVKGYAKHEGETLEKVVQARSAAVSGGGAGVPADTAALKKFQSSQDQLSGAIGRLMVIVEKYPDLKADQGFRDLQSQLEGTENRIAVERRRFSEMVQEFNTAIRMFPGSFIASMKGLQPKAYFEAQAGAATAPKVEF